MSPATWRRITHDMVSLDDIQDVRVCVSGGGERRRRRELGALAAAVDAEPRENGVIFACPTAPVPGAAELRALHHSTLCT
jgi:hypothetical protein